MNTKDKKSLVEALVKGKEDELIEKYISDGPTALKKDLGVDCEQWRVIFDYLVFEHNLLYKCVTKSPEFFVEEYIKHGVTQIREILDVVELKYDMLFEVIFDFIAVCNDGLYFHVIENRDRYMVALKARGGDFVRKVLGIWKDKYEETWRRVLDFLLHAVCDGIFSEQTFEHGLRAFSGIMNGIRDHRALNKYGLII